MPDSLVTRPLKTGRKFRLVVPQHRVFLLRWDKAQYVRGDDAELSVEGRQLGPDDLGSWGSAATLRAQVDADGSRAACKWKLPADRADCFRFKFRTHDGRDLT